MINDFYKFHRRKIRRSDYISLLFCGLVLIIIGIKYLLEGSDYFFGLICNIIFNALLISLGIYLLAYALKYQKYDRKESKKIYDDDISTYINYYYFNDERAIIKNKIGTTERTYDCLEAIYETKDCYYILITKNSGYVMKKDSVPHDTLLPFSSELEPKRLHGADMGVPVEFLSIASATIVQVNSVLIEEVAILSSLTTKSPFSVEPDSMMLFVISLDMER